ncbi:MAG: hypothetical protein KDD78_05470 [Caldilineaceae bacterium]|nr:hypothetical protein [Caldilineaceae bacterium]
MEKCRLLTQVYHDPSYPAKCPKREPVSALEVMAANPALVLLGAADAGKSAFAKQFLARVAAARLGEDEPLAGWPGDFVPLLLNVRDLGQVLERLELDDDKCRQ